MSKSIRPEKQKYYVYEWFIKDTKEIFYVGKGCRARWKTKKRENKFFMNMLEAHVCEVRKVKENLTEQEAFALEIKLIAYYRKNTDFRLTNIQDGGENPPTFYGEESPSKRLEVRNKIGTSNHKRYVENPELRDEISQRMRTFCASEEGKAIVRRRSKKIMSMPEVRYKISESNKAYYTTDKRKVRSEMMKKVYLLPEVRNQVTGVNNGASRKVAQYDLDGNIIAEFGTMKEAGEKTGVSFKNISKAARGHRKTAGGYIWKFVDFKNIVYKARVYKNPPKRKYKPIIQCTINDQFVAEHKSLEEATKLNHFHTHTNISANLKGRTKSAYGYVWKYKE